MHNNKENARGNGKCKHAFLFSSFCNQTKTYLICCTIDVGLSPEAEGEDAAPRRLALLLHRAHETNFLAFAFGGGQI